MQPVEASLRTCPPQNTRGRLPKRSSLLLLLTHKYVRTSLGAMVFVKFDGLWARVRSTDRGRLAGGNLGGRKRPGERDEKRRVLSSIGLEGREPVLLTFLVPGGQVEAGGGAFMATPRRSVGRTFFCCGTHERATLSAILRILYID